MNIPLPTGLGIISTRVYILFAAVYAVITAVLLSLAYLFEKILSLHGR